MKWIGALLIVVGCSLFGFSMASSHRREEAALRQLLGALDYMQCELQYRMTPLPDLCRQAGLQNRNAVGQVLLMLARQLDCQISPNVERCMAAALESEYALPLRSRSALEILGTSLGRFDIEGQIRGMEGVRSICRKELEVLAENREARLRNYQTLGVCAGAALAILLV